MKKNRKKNKNNLERQFIRLQHKLNNTELVESSRWAKGPDENLILVNRRWHLTVNASLDNLGVHQVDNGSERT